MRYTIFSGSSIMGVHPLEPSFLLFLTSELSYKFSRILPQEFSENIPTNIQDYHFHILQVCNLKERALYL